MGSRRPRPRAPDWQRRLPVGTGPTRQADAKRSEMFIPISAWFTAFVVTLLVEAPVVWFLARRAESDLLRLGFLVLFANLVTHPAVWYVFTQLFLVGTSTYTLAAEAWAIAAEALFYWVTIRGLGPRRAITIAVVANLASFLVGRLAGELWPDLIS